MLINDLMPRGGITRITEQKLAEVAGVGRVVKGVNTTADVGPDEIKRQAAKLGMNVDRDGRPPIAKTNGKLE